MPASSINVVELVLTMKDTKPMEKKLDDIETAALNILQSVKKSTEMVIEKTKESVTVLAKVIEEYRTDVINKSLKESVVELRTWFSNTVDSILDYHPALVSSIQKSIIEPFQDAYASIKETGTEVINTVKSTYSEVMEDYIGPLVKEVSGVVTTVYQDSVTKIEDITNEFKKNYPAISGTISGAWHASKVAVLGFTSSLMMVPKIVSTVGKALGTFGSAAEGVFKKTTSTILGTLKIFGDVKDSILNNIKKTKDYIFEVTKLGGIMKKVKQAAKISLVVVGATAAYGLIKSFFSNAKGQILGLGSAFSIISDSFGAALEPIAIEFSKLAEKVAPMLVTLLTPLFEMMVSAMQWVNQAFENILTKSSGLGETMESITGTLTDVLKSVFDVVMIIVKSAVPLIMPLFNTLSSAFKELAKIVVPLIQNIIDNLLPAVMKAMKVLMPVIGELLQTIGESVGGVLKELVMATMPLIEALLEMIPELMPSLKEMIKTVAKLIKSLAPVIAVLIKMVGIIATKLLAPAVLFMLKKLIEGLTLIGDLISNVLIYSFENFGDTVLGTFNSLVDGIGGFFTWLSDTSSAAFEGIFNFVFTMWNKITEFLGLNSIKGSLKGAFGAIMDTFLSTWDVVKEVINEYLIDPVKKALEFDLPVIGSIAELAGIDIQRLASGGVVTSPLLAEIGEAGPEIVIPLKKEVLAEVIPQFVEPMSMNAQFPKVVKTEYGERISNSLDKIENLVVEGSDALRRRANQPPASSPLRTDMSLDFGLAGFVG